ncbi:MAG: hypothetical protein Aurels2KO_28270 [Aureliella sp.]
MRTAPFWVLPKGVPLRGFAHPSGTFFVDGIGNRGCRVTTDSIELVSYFVAYFDGEQLRIEDPTDWASACVRQKEIGVTAAVFPLKAVVIAAGVKKQLGEVYESRSAEMQESYNRMIREGN